LRAKKTKKIKIGSDHYNQNFKAVVMVGADFFYFHFSSPQFAPESGFWAIFLSILYYLQVGMRYMARKEFNGSNDLTAARTCATEILNCNFD
jgi:hypothetical protein